MLILLKKFLRHNPHYEKLTDIPFEIPDSWEWVKLGDVCAYGECDNIEVKNIPETSWILELEDIEKDSGKILQYLTKTERNINGVRHSFKKGDVLYSKLRTYLNKVLVATEDGFCTTEIMPIKVGDLSGEYICQALRSQYFLDYTMMCGYGVKMPRLSTTDAKNGLIPLPPLAEQKRIVDRIEEIFKSLDEISLHLV
ncbi:restriction endonuclease subunit S [uncultured Fibrobacter sp.]|uniref:restriction endonuclease subunit S n=1 Tax=uncultured Fibrobacter sp. TaxID=261512 RepID=UPI0025ED6A85|nr:restriction endonuclease subunit S [uncultured Fibrobacter sp.]